MMKAKANPPKRGTMNKTELEYSHLLGLMLTAGKIRSWTFESIKFKLAGKTFFTPDFIVITKDFEVQAHEVKGFLRDDAAVKFKVAAETFPWIHWIMIRKRAKKHGGGWEKVYDI